MITQVQHAISRGYETLPLCESANVEGIVLSILQNYISIAEATPLITSAKACYECGMQHCGAVHVSISGQSEEGLLVKLCAIGPSQHAVH